MAFGFIQYKQPRLDVVALKWLFNSYTFQWGELVGVQNKRGGKKEKEKAVVELAALKSVVIAHPQRGRGWKCRS